MSGLLKILRRALPLIAALGVWQAVGKTNAANVVFAGATSFTETELRNTLAEQLREIDAGGLTAARADDAAWYLGAFYRKHGFPNSEVTFQIRRSALILKVREGAQVLVDSLKFVGNRSFDEKTLAEYMIGVAPERLVKSKLPFNETEITAGVERVVAFYQSEGFLDVAVKLTGTEITAGGTKAGLVLRITEGPKYFLGAVSFAGHPLLPREELIAALALKPEMPFAPFLADHLQRTLQTFYRSKGFFTATVEAHADRTHPRGRLVPVTFVCEPGVRFRVGAVVPRGMDRLSPEFLEKRFESLTGQIYDPVKIEERYRQLIKTGLFKSLHVRPMPDGPDTLHLEVDVEEAKAKEIGFELGYASYDGAIAGFTIGDRNFLGHGRPLSLSLQYSQRGFRGELLYVNPWLFDSEWMLRAKVFSALRDEIGYSKATEGVRLELTRHFTPHWEAGGYAVFETTKISSLKIDPRFAGPTDYALAAVGLTQTLDYRDDVTNPTRGWVFTASADIDSLDGRVAFARATARYSWYRTFGKTLLGLGARAGWIIPVGNEADVPIDLRFVNGGGTSVRSFAERKLGPKDASGNPLGGDFYTIFNAEWDFPIKGAFGGSVFADAGNLVGASAVSLDDMRYAIGVGLRYQLPIGPLRLDYGYNPSPKVGEASGAVHVSFGFAF